MCSDGLTNMLHEEAIYDIVTKNDLNKAVDTLIDKANELRRI